MSYNTIYGSSQQNSTYPTHNYNQYNQYTGEPFHIEHGSMPGGDLYNGITVQGTGGQQHGSVQPTRAQSTKYMNRMRQMGYDQPVDPETMQSGSANYFLDDSMGQLLGDNQGQVENGNSGQPLKVDVITRYLVIDSVDRDWYNRTDESPYNFKVSIGGGSKKLNGELINAGIDDKLDNVVSITCDNLTAPNRPSITGYRHTNQPFLTLGIEGIDDTTYGSNRSLKASMAQMVSKIPIPLGFQNVTYLEFTNINNHTKVYRTPRATLNTMVISINKSDGEKINNKSITGLASNGDDIGYGDVVSIQQVYYNGEDANSSNKYLDIITSDYFTSDFYQVGDTIKIRGWTFREAGMGYGEITYFTEFINRSEGHIIQLVSKTNGTTELNNTISILVPGYYSQLSGIWEKEKYFIDLVTRTNINDNSSNDNAGKLINVNLQTQLFFRVNTLTLDSMRTQHMIATTAS